MIEKIRFLIEKMPFFSLLAIALKEIDLIKTQKIAIALILLYPIIVILTLGFAYSGNTSLGAIKVGFHVSPEIKSFDSSSFISKLEKSNLVKITIFDSEKELIKNINNKKIKLGIIVREVEVTQGRFVIDVVNNNIDFVSSTIFFQLANDSIRAVGFETSRQLLSEVWANLDNIRKDLGNETTRVKTFISQLEQSEKELLELKNSVKAIDVEEMRKNLNSQKKFVDESGPKLSLFREKIAKFKEIREEKTQKISETKRKIQSYKSDIKEAKNSLEVAKEACEIINDQYNICNKIFSAYNTLAKAELDLDNAYNELTVMENDLAKISTDLAEIDTELLDISNRLEASRKNIDYFNSNLNKISETIDKVNNLIDESLVTKERVSNDLNTSLFMLSSFISKLDELKGLNPNFLANPIVINKISLYRISKLDAIAPGALAIVLMLTTILLTGVSFIVERNEGAFARLILSRTSKTTLFLGKILGQLFFSLLEAALILAVSVLVFQVKLAGNILEIFVGISIVSISFISLGLLITNYTKTQSTTILTGLLIVVPMIFISGTIIPIEFMSKPIQALSNIMPLNLGIDLLVELIIKGTHLNVLIEEILKLLVPAIAFLAFTIFNRNL